MSAWSGILIALAVGLASAVQTAMLGSLGRSRAPVEAAWISLLGSVAGISALMLLRVARHEVATVLPPLDRLWVYAAMLATGLTVLTLSLRGLPWYLGVAGLGGVIYLASAALLVPRLGVALFFGATTAGSVLGALAVDHVGAFGAAPTPVSFARAGGLALILVGVVVVRAVR
jgi:transporter family-2 protein